MKKVLLLIIAMFFLSSKPLFAEIQLLQGTQTGEFDDFIITWTISGEWCSINKVNYPKNWDIKSIQLVNDPLMSKEWDHLTVKLVKDPLMPKEWDALTVQLVKDLLKSKEWDALTVQLVKDLLKSKELEQDKVTYWNFYLTYKIGNNLMTKFFVTDLTHAITLIHQCYTAEAISQIIWEKAK